jgi:serine/threonine-protein kinase
VTPADVTEPVGPAAVGSNVGRYVVLEEIGRGGMGRVLRAYDPKLQREVALKEVRRSLLGSDGTIRLVAEARAMAKLSHTNVVSVFDVVEFGDEATETTDRRRLVLVLELVVGTTLRGWLKEQERPWREIVARYVEAGHGLAAAHDAGLLHRDFKPANVLISDQGQIKVTDFGLAKGVDTTHGISASGLSSRDSGDAITEVGVVMGTPRYMAPEQHAGRALSPATDQYAFCLALWESLHDAPPFSGKDLAKQKTSGPPRWCNEVVPRRLAQAIERGLNPDPDQRWPNMQALLAALSVDADAQRHRSRVAVAALLGVTVATVGYASWAGSHSDQCSGAAEQLEGTWDPQRRRQVEAAMLTTDAAFARGVWERTEEALDDYTQRWIQTHTDACEATAVRGEQSEAVMDLRMGCLYHARMELDAVVGVLSTADADVIQNAHRLVGDLRDLELCDDIDALQADVKPPPAELREVVDDAYGLLSQADAERVAGRYEASQSRIDAAVLALAEVEYDPVQAELAMQQGLTAYALGDLEASAGALERAVRLGTQARHWKLVNNGLTSLVSVVGFEQRRMDEALRYLPMAEGLATDPDARASLLNEVGRLRQAQGKFAESEAELRRALALRREALGPDHPHSAMIRSNIATALAAQGKLAEAEAECRHVIEMQQKDLGPDHPEVAASRNNLAAVLQSQGKYEEAEAEFRAVLKLLRDALGPEHPHVAMAMSSLGLNLQYEGRYEEAEAQLVAAVDLLEHRLGPEHPELAASLNNLCNVRFAQKKYPEAAAAQQRALNLWVAALGEDHPDVGLAHNNLGVIYMAQGDLERAESEHRQALAIREKALAPDNPDLAQSRYNLARLLLQTDRVAPAVELAEAAWNRFDDDSLPPGRRASAAFLLAQALWRSDPAEHPRARELAQRAQEDFAKAGSPQADKVDEVAAWLDAHRERGQ